MDDDCLHVLIADIVVRSSNISLHTLLRTHGLNPAHPYTQRDRPNLQMHEFIQERQYTLLPTPPRLSLLPFA